MTPVKITAELSGAAADYAPQLDALLVELACHRAGVPRDRIPSRGRPAPDPLDCPPVPLGRAAVNGWPVFRVSAPVVAESGDLVSHFGKRIGVERSGLLAPGERKVVVTTNTWTKSYRLPVRVVAAPRVVWFAATPDPDALAGLLADATHVGRKVAHGWGRVGRWRVEPAAEDWSWYAPGDDGRPVLMRTLPLGPGLPADLDGWRPDFDAACPPYWHRDRRTEVAKPC